MAPSKDRISNLSNKLICHILSYVSTKQAVTTGVLSKRWINLWRSVPLLHFSDIKLDDEISILLFNQFVFSVILSREAASNHSIDSFYLDIVYANINHVESLSIHNLTTAINHVVQSKVKYLHLLLHSDDDNDDYGLVVQHIHRAPKLPNAIISCKTLAVLNLSWFNVEGFSFSSVGFEFPSLKKLHLYRIRFDDAEIFWLLVAGCPVLQDFKARDVLAFEEDGEEVTQSQVFHSLSFSELIRAEIINIYCDFPMKSLFNLKFLRIQLWKVYTPYDYPTFNNLTHLVINYYKDMFIKVLYHCPDLQNLELYQKTQTDLDENIRGGVGQESWVDPECAPLCLSLYLRTCTIRDFGFVDLQHDIVLAKYILNNAKNLQTMTIWSDKKRHQVERKLSSCPRASATCQLSVY